MITIKKYVLTLFVMMLVAGETMAGEEAEYSVVLEDDKFELRQYEPHIVAETLVDGDFEDAGSSAFKALFGYISGDNKSQQDISMTAPVSQEVASEKIAMTSPVGQQKNANKWAVSFMMPASYSLETLPAPTSPNITLRQVPERFIASISYSGFWSESGYTENKQKLDDWINKNNYTVIGEPVWARYNPPFTPWFLRRNEVLIPIENPAS